MRVTMIENVRSEDGLSILVKGVTYTVGDAFGRSLCDSQPPMAADTDSALRRYADQLSVSETAAARALVTTPGNLASSALSATVGTPGQMVRLSDGDDKGAILVWAIPTGASAYTWCWWLSPGDAY